MYLIVGLGNPGPQYESTRHNAGFRAVDTLADSSAPWKSEHRAFTQKVKINSQEVIIAKPQTFMNLSGDAVQPLLSWYKIPPERLIVLVDDVQLDCGRIRVRAKGSHGGQNGLRHIIEKVGDDFTRVRFGIGKCPPQWDLADWVLSKFSKDDAIAFDLVLKHVSPLITTLLSKGIDACMERYNGPLL